MFGPLRVDVAGASVEGEGVAKEGTERVDVWQTFWGNEWSNKGEYRGGGTGPAESASTSGAGAKTATATVEVRPEGVKEFYSVRQGCEYSPPHEPFGRRK